MIIAITVKIIIIILLLVVIIIQNNNNNDNVKKKIKSLDWKNVFQGYALKYLSCRFSSMSLGFHSKMRGKWKIRLFGRCLYFEDVV